MTSILKLLYNQYRTDIFRHLLRTLTQDTDVDEKKLTEILRITGYASGESNQNG